MCNGTATWSKSREAIWFIPWEKKIDNATASRALALLGGYKNLAKGAGVRFGKIS